MSEETTCEFCKRTVINPHLDPYAGAQGVHPYTACFLPGGPECLKAYNAPVKTPTPTPGSMATIYAVSDLHDETVVVSSPARVNKVLVHRSPSLAAGKVWTRDRDAAWDYRSQLRVEDICLTPMSAVQKYIADLDRELRLREQVVFSIRRKLEKAKLLKDALAGP